MKPAFLTPREFLVLNMLTEGRYYRLEDIRTHYERFLALYADSLGYLQGTEPFAKVIWQLLSKGHLIKAKVIGCNLLLCLSPESVIHATARKD